MTAAELDTRPVTQETLILMRLEQAMNNLCALATQIASSQEALEQRQATLEQRVERWIDPTMDVADTLHQDGELLAKLLAASVAHGKALAALDKRIQDLTRTSDGVLELTTGFDHDPVRRLVQV